MKRAHLKYTLLEPRILFAGDQPANVDSSSSGGSELVPEPQPSGDVAPSTEMSQPAAITEPAPAVSSSVVEVHPIFQLNTSAAPTMLQDAAQTATQAIQTFLARPDASTLLDGVFSGAKVASPDRDAAIQTVIRETLTSSNSISIELRSDSELAGAQGAFAAKSPDGSSKIFLNADWLMTASKADALRVLVEEYGHYLDYRINGSADTAGDEGEVFATEVVYGADPFHDQLAGADNDHRTLSIDGVYVDVETAIAREVSIVFTRGYFGTQGTNTNKANNIINLSSVDVARIAFVQSDADGDGQFGGTQGNDLAGTLKIYRTDGTVVTLTGALNWRETTGSTVEVFGFIFDSGQTSTLNYGVSSSYTIRGGTTSGTSTTLGLEAATSTWTFTNGENRTGNAATSGLLSSLNSYLTTQPAVSSVTVSTNNVTEGGNLVYSVSLSKATTETCYFVLSTGGTAATADYTTPFTFSNGVTLNSDGTLSVPTGVSSFTVTVATVNDSDQESTETLDLAIGGKTASGSIIDDDSKSISVNDVTVSESSDYAVFQISLNAALASTSITFTPTLSDGTATVGTDTGSSSNLEYLSGGTWVSASSGITLAAGTTSVLVRTAITHDTVYEGRETFTLSTGAITYGAGGETLINGVSGASGTGTIADNGTSTNVFLGTNNTATPTSGTSDNDKPTISVNDVTVSEASPYAVFRISIDNTSTTDISFTPTLTSGGATTGTDTGASSALEYYSNGSWVSAASGITIAAGSSSVLVRTAIVNDSTYEGSEDFTLSTGTVTGGVTNSAGASGTGTIKDDGTSTNVFYSNTNSATPATGSANDDRPSVSITDIEVNENSPYAVFKVTLSAASASNITFTPSLSDGSATGGTDFGSTIQYFNGSSWVSAASGVTIAAGSTTVLMRTTITDDTPYEGRETFTLSTGSITGGVSNSGGVTGTATILDDGTGAIYPDNTTGNPDQNAVKDDDRTVRVNSILVNENSPYAVFRVTSDAAITLTLSLQNDSDVGTNDASLGTDTAATSALQYFNGSSWVTYTTGVPVTAGQTLLVRLAITDDTSFEGAETFQLVATPSSGTAGTGTATIVDDGTGNIYPDNTTGNPDPDAVKDDDRAVAINDIWVNENSPYAVFRVTSNASTSVTLSLRNDSSLTSADATLGTDTAAASTLEYFDSGSWHTYTSAVAIAANGELLVRVAITDDTTYEGPETFQLVATPTSGADAVGTATILDDGTGTIYPNNTTGNPDPDAVLDDDRPVRVADIIVNENSPYAVFSIQGTAGQSITLALQNDNDGSTGDAALGTDAGTQLQYLLNGVWTNYTPGASITLPAGGVLNVRNAINDDTVFEGPETYQLVVTPSGGNAAYANATIVDDGTGLIYPDSLVPNDDPSATKDDDRAVTVNNIAVNENSPYAVFSVTSNATQLISLALQNDADLSTANALLGTDTGAANSLQYFDGSTWQTYSGPVNVTAGSTLLVRIAISDDSTFEGPETFQLAATPASGNTAYGTATIYDDGRGDIYPNNNTGATDPTASKDDDRTVTVSNITVNENSPYAVFQLTSNATQSISLALQNDSDVLTSDATLGTDTAATNLLQYYTGSTWQTYSGSVTITSGTTLLVRIAITDDTPYEGSETFQLAVTHASGAKVSYGTATILDVGTGDIYPNNTTGAIDPSAVKDDDGAVSIADVTVNEASNYVVFDLTGGGGRRISLSLIETAGTGYADIDQTQTLKVWNAATSTWDDYSSSVMIPTSGKLYIRASITAEQDTPYEGAETFKLRATLPSGTQSDGTATIIDDGTGTKYSGAMSGGTPVTSNSGLEDDRAVTVNNITVNEGSPYAVFQVSGIAGQTVSLALQNDSDPSTKDATIGTDLNSQLQYYDGSAWQTYTSGTVPIPNGGVLLVRVAINQDNDYEVAETFQLAVTAASGTATGTATIRDDNTGDIFPNNTTGAVDPTAAKDDDTPAPPPLPPVAAPPPPPPPAAAPAPPVAAAPISQALAAIAPRQATSSMSVAAPLPTAPAAFNLPSFGAIVADLPEFSSDGSFKVNVVDTAADPGTIFSATLANGQPLPQGVTIDPATGQISGRMPDGTQSLDVKIIATTPSGSRSMEINVDATKPRAQKPQFFALLERYLEDALEDRALKTDDPITLVMADAVETGANAAANQSQSESVWLPSFSHQLQQAFYKADA